MTSGFRYKGVDIYQITTGSNTTGTAVPGYNFNGTQTPYNGLIPNDFGFLYKNTTNGSLVPASNLCTARYTPVYTTPGSITVPTGCKSVSFLALGGAGGAGGSSGTIYGYRSSISVPSAPGGSGGNADQLIVQKYTLNSTSTINYNIGTSGNFNSNGANATDWTVGPRGPIDNPVYSGAGGKGNQGNATICNISSSSSPTTTFTANGGNGGDGGNAGYSSSPAGTKISSNTGNPGYPSPISNFPTTINLNYPTNGNGTIQFIWFYD
jgi:hypothetical protein